MARELITSWSDYQSAIDRLLAIASDSILIYDENLAQIRPDSSVRLEALKRVTQAAGPQVRVRIALRDMESLPRQHPLLVNLLNTHGHLVAVQQTPGELAHLRDAMLIVDSKHGLIRFDKDQPRSKLLIDENDELTAYRKRFEEIWHTGGEFFSPRPLGL